MMAILPIGINLMNWASALRNEYADQDFPILSSESGWKRWATDLQAVPVFTNKGIPNANGFASWQDWAMRFTAAIGA